jgi:DNA-directed RNA polymerase specialized sigma24 family protein
MESSSRLSLTTAPAEGGEGHDPILAVFMEASDPEVARRALGDLLEVHAMPVLRAVTRTQLAGSVSAGEGQDREDVVAGALLRLSEHLWSQREGGSAPIRSFSGYVVTTAQNACHAFLRRRQPERARLRSRLRYLLTHDPQLALWEGGAEPLCGLAGWRARPASAEAAGRLSELRGRVAADYSDRDGSRALAFARLVRHLLTSAGGPCKLNELITILEDILGVGQSALSTEESRGETLEIALASNDPSPAEVVEQRDDLERLWLEVGLLPRHQRVAVLLNLKDAAGRDMIGLLPLIGLATRADIAAVLEMPTPRLEAIWEDLPKEDQWIAEELGVTRRQVINFRKCARERLWRRMRLQEEP